MTSQFVCCGVNWGTHQKLPANPKSLPTLKHALEGRGNEVLYRFQQLRSYRDEIETRNWEKTPFSSRMVQRDLSDAEGP